MSKTNVIFELFSDTFQVNTSMQSLVFCSSYVGVDVGYDNFVSFTTELVSEGYIAGEIIRCPKIFMIMNFILSLRSQKAFVGIFMSFQANLQAQAFS